MKKFAKVSLVSLLAGAVLFTTTGCLGKPPQPELPDNPGGGGTQTSVDDVYDYNGDGTGSTRPEIPGGSYEPSLPVTESVVHIAENSAITFADGSRQKTLALGVPLTQADFAEATLNGHEIGGMGVVGENGDITNYVAIADFMPQRETTVMPYYAEDNGSYLWFGSAGYDYATGGLSAANIITQNVLIDGYAGREMSYESAVTSGAQIRVKSTFARQADTTYTYYYTFKNFGDETLTFTVYQINSGSAVTGSEVVASDQIVIEPNEAKSIVLVHEYNKSDTNSMTTLKFGSDLEHGFDLGVVMEISDYVEKVPAKITVELPDGLTVDDSYVTDVMAGDALVLPTKEQVNGDGFAAPYGWYNVDTGSVLVAGTKITGDMIIAPYWQTPAGYNYLPIGSGANYGYNFDQTPGDFWINDKDVAYKRSSFTYVGATHSGAAARLVDMGGKLVYLGSMISDTQAVTAGSAIRLDSTYAIDTASYEFCYTVRNNGSSDLKLSIYQVSASSEYKSTGSPAFYKYESERYRVEIDLAPGESVSKLGQYALGSNGNALTYIVFEEDVDSFSFGISIGLKEIDAVEDAYKNQPAFSNNVTIDYDSSKHNGVTVSEGYLTQRAGRLLVAPTASEYTCPANDRIASWKVSIGGTEYDLPVSRAFGGLRLPSKASVELIPVFAEYKTVTFKLPSGVSFNGYDSAVRVYAGETLTLPTPSQITVDDGRSVLYWVIEGTETQVANGSTVTENITLTPVLSSAEADPVTMTRGEFESGFTIFDEYINATRKVGDVLVLPTANQYANNTGKRLTGWTVIDKESGATIVENALTADVVIATQALEITPVLKAVATITVNLPSGVTLDGYDNEVLVGETLVLPTAEQIKGGESLGAPTGWYNVSANAVLGGNVTVSGDMTIAPYWNTKNGYSYLPFGSGANYGYNYDQTPGDFYDTSNANNVRNTFKYTGLRSGATASAQFVTANGVTYLGSVFSDTQAVTAGSALRVDSKYTIEAASYEFCYTLYNGGSTTLKLSIYQVAASSEYKSTGSPAFYKYESERYRVEIDLAPGESVSKLGQYGLTSNGNALTYIVFEEDVDSFNFGISVGLKKISAVEDAYKNQPALANYVNMVYAAADYDGITVDESYLAQRAGRLVIAPTESQITNPNGATILKWTIKIDGVSHDLPASRTFGGLRLPSKATVELVPELGGTPITVTVDLPSGMTLKDYDTAGFVLGGALTLPTAANIDGADASGRAIAGWYDPATGAVIENGTKLNGDITIAPYFTPNGTALTPLSGAGSNEAGGAGGPDNISGTVGKNFVKQTGVVGGDELGIILTYNGTLAANDAFRFKTTHTLVNTKKYTFTYRFTNYGNDTLSFKLHQINAGTTTSGMPSEDVEIAAGEKVTVTLTVSGIANSNALSYFVMQAAANSFKLGVSMSVVEEAI